MEEQSITPLCGHCFTKLSSKVTNQLQPFEALLEGGLLHCYSCDEVYVASSMNCCPLCQSAQIYIKPHFQTSTSDFRRFISSFSTEPILLCTNPLCVSYEVHGTNLSYAKGSLAVVLDGKITLNEYVIPREYHTQHLQDFLLNVYNSLLTAYQKSLPCKR